MKPKIVEVDANSPRPERAVGDAPSIGKVAKVSVDDGATSEESDAEDFDFDEENEPGDWLLKLGMISGLVLLALFAVGLIYVSVVRKLDFSTSDPADGQAALDQSRSEDEAAKRSGLDEREALDLVRRALAVRFTSQVMQAFNLPPAVDAMSAVSFLRELPERDGLVVAMEYLPAIEQEGVTLERVRVHCSKDGSRHSRDAYLIEGEEEDWKIDYGSFARRVEPSWEELILVNGSEGIVRVMVHALPESELEPRSHYRLGSPDLGTDLMAWAESDSNIKHTIDARLASLGGSSMMTLRVKSQVFSADSNGVLSVDEPPPRFEILELVSPGWVILDVDDAP